MNANAQKNSPVAHIYCVRVNAPGGGYAYGGPFVAGSDEQAIRLVTQSLSQVEENLDYARGDIICIASYTLWNEEAKNPITKRDIRRGDYVVANVGELMKGVKKVENV